jgi:hypothetical protein
VVELLQKGHGGWEGFMSVVSWYLMHLPSFEFRVFPSSSGQKQIQLIMIKWYHKPSMPLWESGV